MLANALMAGICSVGAECRLCRRHSHTGGSVSYQEVLAKVEAGVVISASHNPVEFNGIKFLTETAISCLTVWRMKSRTLSAMGCREWSCLPVPE